METEAAIWQKLEYIASLLERDLEAEGWTGKTVTLTFKLDTFQGVFLDAYNLLPIIDNWYSFYTYEIIFAVDLQEGGSIQGMLVTTCVCYNQKLIC